MKIEVATTTDLSPRAADESLRFVRSAATTAREQIGFIPWQAVLDKAARSGLLVARLNHDWVGFLLHDLAPSVAKVWQIWMRPDARRILYGSALVNRLVTICENNAIPRIQARCALDLEAVGFWSILGFDVASIVHGGYKRRRQIVHFSRNTIVANQPG